MAVEVLLYKSKKLKNKQYPIMFRVIKDRKAKYISTGVSCFEEDWDERSKELLKTYPTYKSKNKLIKKNLLELEEQMDNLKGSNRNFSAIEVVNKFRGTIEKKTVFVYVKECVERLSNSKRIGSSLIYADLLREMKKFQKEKDLAFSDITFSWLSKFEEYFYAKDDAETTISLYMRTLRAIFNKAINESVCRDSDYPFKQFKISKYNLETKKRAISQNEIEKIINYKVSGTKRLFNSKNYFLFSFFNLGINLIDMAYLKWADVNDERFGYVRSKTGKNFSVKIQLDSEAILNHYKKSKVPNGYVFPIFDDDVHKTQKSQMERLKKIRKYVNADLKTIARNLEIKNADSITHYVARHSWATIAWRNGIAIETIRDALGHDDLKTTRIYLESFENKDVDDANANFMKRK